MNSALEKAHLFFSTSSQLYTNDKVMYAHPAVQVS